MFNLSKSATAIAAAIRSTIQTTDDLTRARGLAEACGYDDVQEWVAHESVNQALAIKKVLEDNALVPVCVLESDKAEPATVITDFADGGKSAQEVFAKSATEQVVATTPAPPVPIVEAQESIDTPLPPANSAEVQDDTTSTNTTTANVSGVDLDSEGLPWDARIHSSSKAKIKDKTWKLKRNLDPLLIDDVKAELRGVMAIPAVEPQTNVDTNPSSVATVNKLIDAGNGGTAIAPPPPVASEGITTFPELMKAITTAKLDSEFVKSILAQFDIPAIPVLATRPDLIPTVAQGLGL